MSRHIHSYPTIHSSDLERRAGLCAIFEAGRRSPEEAGLSKVVTIAGRPIGREYEPYVVCELSGNHNGSLERALELLDARSEEHTSELQSHSDLVFRSLL